MQVKCSILQFNLTREWSRFVTVVKQRQEIDTVSYHKLFDVLKQFQNEVNDIRSERLARSANPLALLAGLLNNIQLNYYSYNNDNQSGQFGNQRTMTVAGARETGVQEAKGGLKNTVSKGEKMMMCKQVEQGVPLQAEQADWLEDTDEEIDEQELEAHYSYMAKIQEIVQLILFIVDSGCTKHMTGNLKLLCNFVEKFLGYVQCGKIDSLLNFLVMEIDSRGMFAFRKSIVIVRDLHGYNVYLLGSPVDLIYYTFLSRNNSSSTPICFMVKASPTQAWLWHRRLSHLNFDYITLLSKKDVVTGLPKLTYVKDQLCSSCEMSKAKRSSFKTKANGVAKRSETVLLLRDCSIDAIQLPSFHYTFWAEAVATAMYYSEQINQSYSTHGLRSKDKRHQTMDNSDPVLVPLKDKMLLLQAEEKSDSSSRVMNISSVLTLKNITIQHSIKLREKQQ
ncbi:retrovirus-related pol polyprotein from transposon TNT 1-94 [Tanacetum coccineum]